MCQALFAALRNVRMLYVHMKIPSSWGDVLGGEAEDEQSKQ